MSIPKNNRIDHKLSSDHSGQYVEQVPSALSRYERVSGQMVILCHGAASHSGQWRALTKDLSSRYRVIAFDQYGYRNSPAWTAQRPMLIQDQAAPIIELLRERLQSEEKSVHLVGHSHGASIAACIASELSESIASISMYEPNTFGLLRSRANDLSQYENIIGSFGDLQNKMSTFESREMFAKDLMNFWLGDQSWASLDEKLRLQLISVMKPTAKEVYSALYSHFDLSPLMPLGDRVQMMYDPYSPAAARLVTERYITCLKNAKVSTFDHCGHLAPIFHADRINKVIIQHISHFSSQSI